MDALPPDDPNRNQPPGGGGGGGRNTASGGGKEMPQDGSSRRGQNPDGTMDVLGDWNDGGVAVVMFMMGVATWFLRERCVC